MKFLKATSLVLVVLSFSTVFNREAGATESRARIAGLSKTELFCENAEHQVVSYEVQVLTAAFEKKGRRAWTKGADVYEIEHSTGHRDLIKHVAIDGPNEDGNYVGDGFSMVRKVVTGPGNFDMKWDAFLTVDQAFPVLVHCGSL